MDRREIRQLLAAAVPVGEDERGNPTFAMVDLIKALKGRGGSDAMAQRTAAALARQQEADADNAEIKRDESLKRLLDGETVFGAWEEIIVPAKTKFQALPSKLASSAGLSAKQQEKLEREISDILEELSRAPNYKAKQKESEE